MTKQELFELLKEIAEYYPAFIDVSDKDAMVTRAKVWYRALEKFDIDSIRDKLADYATKSEYPPKVSDLVKGLNIQDIKHNIPGLQETKQIIAQYKPLPEEDRPTQEQIRQMIADRLGKDFLK